MSRTASPLRYPGGKACLYSLAVDLLRENNLTQSVYVEPYSGGCGLALSLLFSGHVSQIHINDLDRSVWAFWYSICHNTDEFVDRILQTDVSVDEWERQRAIQSQKSSADALDLGFSTFFLNRTNRSGIIHGGGIIGGKGQTGDWKIDCRFNKPDLVSRIKRVAAYRNRIFIYNEDAESFVLDMDSAFSKPPIMYIDPPYYEKGSQLYKNSYKNSDHARVRDLLEKISSPWFMTYDNVTAIRELYSNFEKLEIEIGYSAQTKRSGSEVLVVSPSMSFGQIALAA